MFDSPDRAISNVTKGAISKNEILNIQIKNKANLLSKKNKFKNCDDNTSY